MGRFSVSPTESMAVAVAQVRAQTHHRGWISAGRTHSPGGLSCSGNAPGCPSCVSEQPNTGDIHTGRASALRTVSDRLNHSLTVGVSLPLFRQTRGGVGRLSVVVTGLIQSFERIVSIAGFRRQMRGQLHHQSHRHHRDQSRRSHDSLSRKPHRY